jgi:hypothetical protein
MRLPYLKGDTNQHGTKRLFVRRFGRTIRLRTDPDDKRAFLAEYNAALEALESGTLQRQASRSGAPAGTLGWLAATYFAAVEFTGLPSVSQATRRGIIEACLQEPIKPGSKDKMALCPLALLSAAHVKMLRDRKADKPGAANNRLKYLSSMFSWAIERNPPLLRSNPARDVRSKKYATEGFHSWAADEVQRFEDHHPIGTKPRLAFALMYYLGVRRSDAVSAWSAAYAQRNYALHPGEDQAQEDGRDRAPDSIGTARDHRGHALGRHDVPDDRTGQAVHVKWIRQLVSRSVQRCGLAPVQRSRVAQGAR